MTFLNVFFLMGSPEGGGDGAMINLIFLGALFFVFYFFIIRPQSKRQKEIQKKVSELKKGDKVVTSGGMIGTVNTIDEDTVLLEIDSGVKARFQKGSITDVNPNKNKK
ncbi:preprotein translocase subunit YajC [Rhodohalobacter barkolensis]|jgi:preprotein translocase subunit YajC|uniref:Sec translocon accessory complex subunit YajC n=1 Tax=Rhodohalobacter barkolensis TaxID=2053187 RepID=A0A2N0VGH5_9BACT|nr:preprotein translocase subunit YajC [Rhodohalobacter barkolensis]PKD43302.1 preprotein translocase subunit YajC [Rhodohalobacter barkolensis]